MKKLFIIVFAVISIAATCQSNLEKGARIGQGESGDLIDSLKAAGGKVLIGIDGSDYTLANDADVIANSDSIDANAVTIATKASTDTTNILRTNQNAKIALDEMHRLDALSDEGSVGNTDTLTVMVNGNEVKVTKNDFLISVFALISAQETEIAILQDSLADQRTDMQAMELINDYDSIRINDAKDAFYLWVTDPTGQYRATLSVDLIDDPTDPTVLSMVVDAPADRVVITMSEYMMSADSSINRFTGSGGGNWSGITSAYPMNELSGNMLDVVGTDHGVITESPAGSLQGDSSGVASGAYYFDGTNDYVTITGKDHASDDVSMSMWVFPHDLSSDGNFIGGGVGALFWGFQATTDGLRLGRVTDALSSTTTISLTENEWNHIVFAYDQAANEVTFWIDGISEVESFSTTFTAATTAVGVRAVGVSGYFNGLMDDLFIWEGVEITNNTVDSIYNSGPPGRRYDESGGGVAIFQDSIKAAFTISNADIGGTSYTVDSIPFMGGNQIWLDLDNDITYGDAIRVSYNESVNYGLRDTSSNFAESWSLFTIDNQIDTSANYTVYEEWDFESLTAGDGVTSGGFSDDEIKAYWPTWDHLWSHTHTGDTIPYIVEDTINGAATNVLRIKHRKDDIWAGFDISWDLDSAYQQILYSYNIKFGENIIGFPDMKLPGMEGSPSPGKTHPTTGIGYRAQVYDQYGEANSYFYDRTKGIGIDGWSPHDMDTDDLDSVFFVPNVWYQVLISQKINGFDGSTSLLNGVFEWAKNGWWVNQVTGLRTVEDVGAGASGAAIRIYTGGSPDSDNYPNHDCYVYVDNFKILVPHNDDVFGTHGIHDASVRYFQPDEITDNEFNPDSTRITIGTLTNEEWGTDYSNALEEQYQLDAGAGNTVTITFNNGAHIGSNDHLYIYDGNTTGATLVAVYRGQSIATSTSHTSTGRYLFMRFASWNESHGAAGWSVAITHDDALVCGIGSSSVNGPDEAYDLLGAETGYTMTNLATAGDYTNDQLADWNALSTAAQQAFTHVLVMIGMNDVIGGHSLETCKTDFQDMIDAIAGDINASCKIISYTLSPARANASMSAGEYIVWGDFNTWMSASLTNVYVVSTKHTVDLNDGSDNLDAAYDSGDGLHPNAAGTQVILQNLKDEID